MHDLDYQIFNIISLQLSTDSKGIFDCVYFYPIHMYYSYVLTLVT